MRFHALQSGSLIIAALAVPGIVSAAEPVQARASGEVVRVNASAGQITIRHGAIPRLELPAMTLVYRADPALLAGVSVGDRVDFTAERIDNQYRIVELRK